MTDDDKTPDPTPALLPPARLAEIRERARLSSLPHVAELLAHLDALAPCAVPDGEALGRGLFETWSAWWDVNVGPSARRPWDRRTAADKAPWIAQAIALHDIGYARRRSEGEAERVRLSSELADLRAKGEADREVSNYREAEIARLTAELAGARAAVSEMEARLIDYNATWSVMSSWLDCREGDDAQRPGERPGVHARRMVDAARRDGAREERRLTILDMLTVARETHPSAQPAVHEAMRELGKLVNARGEDRPPCPGEGWEWDAFALQWHQPGAKGKAIASSSTRGEGQGS